jgi:hypothetical protein
MADRILALKAGGQKVIGLQVGDPDFATPPAVVEVAMNAMRDGLTHYTSSRGTPDLLRAIAHKLQRDEGLSYDPASEILATHGGIHAYYTAMQSILNPGDEVLVPDPSWATHANMAVMLRGEAIRIPAPAENGFIPHFDSWDMTRHSRLLRERTRHFRRPDAQPRRLGQQRTHQPARLPRPLLLALRRGQRLHERARTLTHLHEPLPLQVAVRLHHRRRVHAQRGRQLPHRRQRLPSSILLRRHRHADACGNLLVERYGTAWIDLVVHALLRARGRPSWRRPRGMNCMIVAIQ